MTVTLEDIYRILRLPICGARVSYDLEHKFRVIKAMYEHEDVVELGIEDYEIWWEVLENRYERFDYILCTLIIEIIILDHRGNGFLVGWGEMLVGMMSRGTIYAWGPYFLSMIYFQLHDVAYHGA